MPDSNVNACQIYPRSFLIKSLLPTHPDKPARKPAEVLLGITLCEQYTEIDT